MKQIILKSGKDQALRRKHPWVFSGAIKAIKGNPQEGDVVEVRDNQGTVLGIGHYQSGSIAVRLFCFEKSEIDDSFWSMKIQEAWRLRKTMGFPNAQTNLFRLIHAEADGFPGLIVDVYHEIAVFQAHSVGMYRIRETLAKLLVTEIPMLKAVYDKSVLDSAEQTWLIGQAPPITAQEYGNAYQINVEDGQKTGFFIDQRENRKLLEDFCKDKTVLNLCAYTGGFSVAALKGGAKQVVSVDVSAKAMPLLDENIRLNFPTAQHTSVVADAFDYLKSTEIDFEVMILDPPAFAKHRAAVPNALKGYRRLNQVAFEKIKKGGIIFTFSCSQVIDKQMFREAVMTAAVQAGREVKILHQLTQPADHPISIFHPEGEYLKGLVLWVA